MYSNKMWTGSKADVKALAQIQKKQQMLRACAVK